MFIKGVTYHNHKGEPETVTLAGFLSPSAPHYPVLAVFIDETGRFKTASIDNFKLNPRQPIGGYRDGQ
jgi:hypothetical protein